MDHTFLGAWMMIAIILAIVVGTAVYIPSQRHCLLALGAQSFGHLSAQSISWLESGRLAGFSDLGAGGRKTSARLLLPHTASSPAIGSGAHDGSHCVLPAVWAERRP